MTTLSSALSENSCSTRWIRAPYPWRNGNSSRAEGSRRKGQKLSMCSRILGSNRLLNTAEAGSQTAVRGHVYPLDENTTEIYWTAVLLCIHKVMLPLHRHNATSNPPGAHFLYLDLPFDSTKQSRAEQESCAFKENNTKGSQKSLTGYICDGEQTVSMLYVCVMKPSGKGCFWGFISSCPIWILFLLLWWKTSWTKY